MFEIELFDHFIIGKQMTDELLVIYSNTWNHVAVKKRISLGSFKNVFDKMCYLMYKYKDDMPLNDLKYHKTKPAASAKIWTSLAETIL